jgi:hypothetical protein
MGIHDDTPLEDDYDPELRAFQEETGYDTYYEFYENEARIEAEETKETENLIVNLYEINAIGYGLQHIADLWWRKQEKETHYHGKKTPKLVRGAWSLASKIGLRLVNKYYDEGFVEWRKTAGKFDEYPLQWFTDEQLTAIEKEKLVIAERNKQFDKNEPEKLLSDEQIFNMKKQIEEIFKENDL